MANLTSIYENGVAAWRRRQAAAAKMAASASRMASASWHQREKAVISSKYRVIAAKI